MISRASSECGPRAPIDAKSTPGEVMSLQALLEEQGFLGRYYHQSVFDRTTDAALRLFQTAHGVEETGVFDPATEEVTRRWWCGTHYSLLFRAPPAAPCQQAISNATLTIPYRIAFFPPQPSNNEVRAAIANAFTSWSQLFATLSITLTAVEVAANPKVAFSWVQLGSMIAATGSSPHNCPWGDQGQIRMRLSDSPGWSVDGRDDTWDVEYVALHELGHLWGIRHSADGEAVMHERVPPNGQASPPKRTLTAADLGKLDGIY